MKIETGVIRFYLVVPIFEEGLNSDKQSIKTIQTLFLWVNIPPHIKFH